MGNIKTKVGILLLTSLLVVSCKEEKTAVFNLNLEQNSFPSVYAEYLMVQNPPEDIDSIISFFYKEVRLNKKRMENNIKKIIIERNIAIDSSREKNKDSEYEYLRDWKNISEKDIDRCVSVYFKDRLFFDRTYKVPTQALFRWIRVFVGYDTQHNGYDGDRFVKIFYKYDENEKDEPVTPFLYIYKLGIYYYPKGLRNNPNIHWEKLKQPEDEGYYYIR